MCKTGNESFFHCDLAAAQNIKLSLFLLFIHPFSLSCTLQMGFSSGTNCKELACQCTTLKRHAFDPWVGKIPWRRAWQPILVFLLGEFHGQRTLVGYSPWSHKELDMIKQLPLLIQKDGSLIRRWREFKSLPCEDRAGRGLPANQEESPHRNTTMPAS